jgi:hypothetical protein
MGRKYTPAESQYIRDNYQHMSDEEIGEALGRRPLSIQYRRRYMQLHHDERLWSEDDAQYVRDNYMRMSDREIAHEIGCPPESVGKYRSNHGLLHVQPPAPVIKCPSEPTFVPGPPMSREMLDIWAGSEQEDEPTYYERHDSGIAIVTPTGERIGKYCPAYGTAEYIRS